MRSLSVISSNIRYDEPGDDRYRWAKRRDFLAATLMNFSPDVIATQEGKLPQLQELAASLPEMTCADAHRDWQPDLMYPCLFYNAGSLTLLASGDVWLSETPEAPGSSSFGSLFPRLCTWARFEGGLLVANVHLDNSSSDTRVHQARVLIDEMRALRQSGESVLLTGDFNESPDNPVRSVLQYLWPDLNDPWQQLGQPEEASHHNFDEPIDYGTRIDWMLVSRNLKVRQIYLDKSQSEEGIYPSDHYPLKASFELASDQ